MVLCTYQKRRNTDTQSVTLRTNTEIIHPTTREKLLGYTVQENLGFGQFLIHGKDSVVNSLAKRIGGLKKIIKISSFRTRLSVCTSLVMSRILYMLPLYSGCPEYILSALQTKQTEAMRIVTGRKWEVLGVRLTSTCELLKQCGYLSVRQMCYYYSVSTVHNIITYKQPEYMCSVLSEALQSGVQHRYPTRQAADRQVQKARLTVANSSFRWRAATQYSLLPFSLRNEPDMKVFLSKLKKHTQSVVYM